MKHTIIFYFDVLHSSSPKTDCITEKTHSNCGKTVALTFIITTMLPEINTRYFPIYGKSRKQYEKHYFHLF